MTEVPTTSRPLLNTRPPFFTFFLLFRATEKRKTWDEKENLLIIIYVVGFVSRVLRCNYFMPHPIMSRLFTLPWCVILWGVVYVRGAFQCEEREEGGGKENRVKNCAFVLLSLMCVVCTSPLCLLTVMFSVFLGWKFDAVFWVARRVWFPHYLSILCSFEKENWERNPPKRGYLRDHPPLVHRFLRAIFFSCWACLLCFFFRPTIFTTFMGWVFIFTKSILFF